MADHPKGRLDPARTLSLLWGTRQLPRRGPKHGLTSAQVLNAAIEIADADRDLSQLSMRRVAESLGVGTMSLYTYVASRDELVAVMLDHVYSEAVRDLNEHCATDWRDGLRAVADANWGLYLRHPWVLQIFTGRPALGPNAIAKYDRELSVIDNIGLSDVEMDSTLTMVLTHVEGVARTRIQSEQVVRHTGLTDQQWWEIVGPAFAQVFNPTQFPFADRVGQAAGQAHQAAHNPEHAYSFGLDRLIDGLAAHITDRRID
jgi:AcrR family transcriptional regulator